MNCRDVILEISNYIDGELDAATKEELETHLALCKHCEIVCNQTKMTVDIFCDSLPVELPPDVSVRLHESLHRKISKAGS